MITVRKVKYTHLNDYIDKTKQDPKSIHYLFKALELAQEKLIPLKRKKDLKGKINYGGCEYKDLESLLAAYELSGSIRRVRRLMQNEGLHTALTKVNKERNSNRFGALLLIGDNRWKCDCGNIVTLYRSIASQRISCGRDCPYTTKPSKTKKE